MTYIILLTFSLLSVSSVSIFQLIFLLHVGSVLSLSKKKEAGIPPISLQRAIIWKAYTSLGHVSILNPVTVTKDMESSD